MKGFCPLASGSKGNSIFLGTSEVKILIDAGTSFKTLKSRLGEINVDIGEIDAILVTHEHHDHIQAIKLIANKCNIPIIANHATAKMIVNIFNECPKFKIFTTGETFFFKDLEIHPFSIQHDTVDPVAFTIQTNGLKLGFCTDLGHVTTLTELRLRDCDYLYIEANHEPSMVHSSSRHPKYKERLLGRLGHLSNEACARLLTTIHHKLKHVHLAHLSSECNSPEKALNVIGTILNEHGISLNMCTAPQDKISKAVYF